MGDSDGEGEMKLSKFIGRQPKFFVLGALGHE
jgi:hypothetical protein